MLGHSHAVSGALGWLAFAPVTSSIVGVHLSVGQMAAGTLACAGAALLPDLDHPQATIAHFLGPVSQLLAKGVNIVAGGHRQATHSFAFVALVGLGTQGLMMAFGVQAALWTMFIMTALALRGLGLVPPGKRSSITNGLSVGVMAFAITYFVSKYVHGGFGFLPLAVALGCLFHIGGDCCTPERCPIFWPCKKRFGVGFISHTGNALEVKVLTPLMGLAVLGLLYTTFIAPLLNSTLVGS